MTDHSLTRLAADLHRMQAGKLDRRADHRLRQVVQRLRLLERRICDTDPYIARELRDIIERMRG